MTNWTNPDFKVQPSTLELWNTYLRDNMTHVKAPPTASYTYTYAASDYKTTSSAAWVAMGTVLTLSLESFGGDILLEFNASIMGTGYLDVAIDEQRQGGNDGILAFTTALTIGTPVRLSWLFQDVVAGTHSFDVYWKAASGSLALVQYVPPSLLIREFS
jgi:hypothetical protein